MCEGRLEYSPHAQFHVIAGGRPRHVAAGAGRSGGTLAELGFGALALQRVFQCVPQHAGATDARAHEVVIQVRTDVSARLVRDDGEIRVADGMVALGAFIEPLDLPVTWVQTGRFIPERITHFGGRAEISTITSSYVYYGESAPSTEPARQAAHREHFSDHGEDWFIDATGSSARYSERGVWLDPAGYSNGEIIYDDPAQSNAYVQFLGDNPDVQSVEAPVEFRTYLYARRGAARGFPATRPLAMVEWWYTSVIRRAAPGGPWRPTARRARVLWIVPNPVPPLLLEDAIRRYPAL